ncbi:unnamed protein product [Nesidiocoris tenuis]|uniref:C2H2-type domain-containing protein n=1 Tax=Nesidiocoris tenuis TaxID=355587 RepID=A0A6H5FY06_9HEMI|nr:unnamed protein product [Nesidiocoris tenuis]
MVCLLGEGHRRLARYLDNSPFSDEGLPPPVVVLKPVKFENEENGDEDLLVYEQIPRPIVLDDDEMEKKPTPPALEDPLAEDNQTETADGNQGLLTLEEELHQRLISTKDDTVHLAFPSDEYSKLTTVQFPRDRNRHHVCPKCNQSYAHRRLLEDHIISCEGTNPVTVDMYQLIEWTTLLSEKIAEVQGIENAINCRVVLNRKETLTPPDPLAEKPRVRKKPVPKPSNKRKAKTDTKTVTEEPTPAVTENNDDVDILGQSDNAEEIVPNKRTRRGKKDDPAVSSSTDDTVTPKGKTLRSGRMVEEPADVPSVVPPAAPPAAPPAKKPRGRRNIRFREPPSEDDELMEPDVDDPDFNPLNEIPARKRKSALGRNYIDYEPDDSSGDDLDILTCEPCLQTFQSLYELRYHLKASAECSAFSQLLPNRDEGTMRSSKPIFRNFL